MRVVPARVRRFLTLFADQRYDLSLLAMVQVPLLALSTLIVKYIAARHAYPDRPLGELAWLSLRVFPEGLLALGDSAKPA